ncbi:hypothetical protein COO60DRAFT_590616 [Scenedesmus sp. NREL 46B-D3]|nr:hypothetical protein COO60DRAFT_590616 [Scenedesmus sp. NREL 46B-D3]
MVPSWCMSSSCLAAVLINSGGTSKCRTDQCPSCWASDGCSAHNCAVLGLLRRLVVLGGVVWRVLAAVRIMGYAVSAFGQKLKYQKQFDDEVQGLSLVRWYSGECWCVSRASPASASAFCLTEVCPSICWEQAKARSLNACTSWL